MLHFKAMVGQRTNAIEKASLSRLGVVVYTPKSSREGFGLKFNMLSIVKPLPVQGPGYAAVFLLETK